MKLQSLLENERRDALSLQQHLLDSIDGLNIELHGGKLHVTFEHWEHTEVTLDIERVAEKVTVGFKPSNGTRTLLRDALFHGIEDPELLGRLRESLARAVGEDVADQLKQVHIEYSNKRKWHFGHPTPGDRGFFKPFPYPVSRRDKHIKAIGERTIAGATVLCMAIMKAQKSDQALEAAEALNKFNDQVLRIKPKPEQLGMGTDSDVTYFIYAVKQA
jgi:hypothetical protein